MADKSKNPKKPLQNGDMIRYIDRDGEIKTMLRTEYAAIYTRTRLARESYWATVNHNNPYANRTIWKHAS